jgi:hypothetical protein
MSNRTIQPYSRRDALKHLTLITAITFTSGASMAFLSGCKPNQSKKWKSKSMSTSQLELVMAACDRILPKTDSPGALDALVHRYIDETITYIYADGQKDRFLSGLDHINALSRSKYKKKFTELHTENQDDILRLLAKEWKELSSDNVHIFKELRDLTVSGFAASEIGATQFFIYDPVPGPYQGCIPYDQVTGTYAL